MKYFNFYSTHTYPELEGHVVFMPSSHAFCVVVDGVLCHKSKTPYMVSFAGKPGRYNGVILSENTFADFFEWYTSGDYPAIGNSRKMSKSQIVTFLTMMPNDSILFSDIPSTNAIEDDVANEIARDFLTQGRFKSEYNKFKHYRSRMSDKPLSDMVVKKCMQAMGYRSLFVK